MYSLCCPSALGRVILHWSSAAFSNKTGSPSHSSSSAGGGTSRHLPSPGCSLSDLNSQISLTLPQTLWIHACNCPAASRTHSSLITCRLWVLTVFPPPLAPWALSLGRGLWYECPIWGWALYTLPSYESLRRQTPSTTKRNLADEGWLSFQN